MGNKELKPIRDELDLWRNEHRVAAFWWRDDDAHVDCPALRTLFSLCKQHNIPCNLATIPAHVEASLVEAVKSSNHVWILQHGYDHTNHAPAGCGAWELGPHRKISAILTDLSTGKNRLESLFGSRFAPILVPPWNRIDQALLEHLPALGFSAFSAEEERTQLPNGLLHISLHGDLLRWKGKKAVFAGAEKIARHLAQALRAKRLDKKSTATPIGILTHHREMDTEAWKFLDALLGETAQHKGCCWLAAPELIPPRGQA